MTEKEYRELCIELDKIDQALLNKQNIDKNELLYLRLHIANYLNMYFGDYGNRLIFDDPPIVFMALKYADNIETNVFLNLDDFTLNKEVDNEIVAIEKFKSIKDINEKLFNRNVNPDLLLSYPFDPLNLDEDYDGIIARYDLDDRDNKVQSYFPDKSLRYEMEQYQEEAVKKNQNLDKEKDRSQDLEI